MRLEEQSSRGRGELTLLNTKSNGCVVDEEAAYSYDLSVSPKGLCTEHWILGVAELGSGRTLREVISSLGHCHQSDWLIWFSAALQ